MALHLVYTQCKEPEQRKIIVERALHEIEREVGDLDVHKRIALTRILEQLRFDSAAAAQTGWFW